MRVLHVVHDFLPKYRAGTEIYVLQLCRALRARHDMHVLCADYDPTQEHGAVRSRDYDGIPVTEIVNNWRFASFAETYTSPLLDSRVEQVLDRVAPDVVHVHSLLTLGVDLPKRAAQRQIPVVLTLHDYALVCASGGKRVHLRDEHVCDEIEPARCARCFSESALGMQVFAARAVPGAVGRTVLPMVRSLVSRTPAVLPILRRAASQLGRQITADEIVARLNHVRRSLQYVDRFVAPSAFIADEFVRFGIPRERVEVSDNGYETFVAKPRVSDGKTTRIGFVGTLSWEKGAHVLIDAVRRLRPGGFELHVFGGLETFPDYVRQLRENAAGLPIHFRGGFEPGRVADVFAELDLLVVPSLWMENSPLVIHEAFLAGVPVVAARRGGMPDLLGEAHRALLYESTDAAELASILQRLIDDPTARAAAASALPAVKSIEADARDWETRYAAAARTVVRC